MRKNAKSLKEMVEGIPRNISEETLEYLRTKFSPYNIEQDRYGTYFVYGGTSEKTFGMKVTYRMFETAKNVDDVIKFIKRQLDYAIKKHILETEFDSAIKQDVVIKKDRDYNIMVSTCISSDRAIIIVHPDKYGEFILSNDIYNRGK